MNFRTCLRTCPRTSAAPWTLSYVTYGSSVDRHPLVATSVVHHALLSHMGYHEVRNLWAYSLTPIFGNFSLRISPVLEWLGQPDPQRVCLFRRLPLRLFPLFLLLRFFRTRERAAVRDHMNGNGRVRSIPDDVSVQLLHLRATDRC